MNRDIEHYKNIDVSRANHVEPEFVKELRKRHSAAQATVLDADVVQWLVGQDSSTKQHINEMIRHAMALKKA